MTDSQQYQVRHGGLMRCCLATLDNLAVSGELPTDIGATLSCQYHAVREPDMILCADGVWAWNKTHFIDDKGVSNATR